METPHEVAVITVPFPGQGHLNQLLQISCLISSYGIPVYYVGSIVQNRQARARINGLNVAEIHFHDVTTPPFASPRPDPNSSSKFPAHLNPAWTASLDLRHPVAAYLNEMAGKFRRVVVVNDCMMAAVVQDAALIPNAESYALNCISAFSLHFNYLSKQHQEELISIEQDDVPEEILDLVRQQSEPLSYRAGDLYNTCRMIEAPYLETLEREDVNGGRKSWAIGPILATTLSPDKQHKCLPWLDKHEPNSVIYVAFGSTVSLSDEEVTELALGLEQSKVKFLWVLKDADKGDVFDGERVRRAELPEGFEERVEGVGMVVRDWAPQPQILSHSSTGGFMSHCGWNSCVESITMGVPVAAWPMHSEQPRNTYLVTEVLKVGLVVRKWSQRKELVTAGKIENAVRRLMASEEGDEMRKRAEELGITVRQATQPGGASRLELDSFIAHITR
ncbi:hypothetical protein ACS0TY_031189 [Phlomoides rotata]